MEGESGVTRRIIYKLDSWNIQGDQMEDESGVTRSIIDELRFQISNEIKWKEKVVLLKVSLMNFILRISEGDQMEDENGVTRSIIDELHSSDIQLDQVECETRVIPSIIYGLCSLDI